MFELGIMGGGQLAMMLLEAAHKLNIRVGVLGSSKDDPAAGAADGFYTDLPEFLKSCKVVIFENEFVDCNELEKSGSSLSWAPTLASLRIFQNKLSQKHLLQRLGIPTSPFLACESSEAAHFLKQALARFGEEVVFKWARLGYDGKGVLIGTKGALEFCREGIQSGKGLYAEAKIPYLRELAIVAIHSLKKDFRTYPLVITEQQNGICKKVYGPAQTTLMPVAVEAAQKIAFSEPGIVGAFALEFFETSSGQLLVNEIAPRVHNSGHYTQDACQVSQFENHIRGVLGLELGSTQILAPAFAMLNLLGPCPITPPLAESGVFVHWYEKKESRIGRKMGHLNGICQNPQDLPKLLEHLENCQNRWLRSRTHGK